MSKRVALEVTRTVRLTELQLGILEAVAARAEAAARRKELCVVGVRELMGEFGCGRSAVINAIGSCIEQDWLTSIAVYRIDGGIMGARGRMAMIGDVARRAGRALSLGACASALLLGVLTGCGGPARDAGGGSGRNAPAPQVEASGPEALRPDVALGLDSVPAYDEAPFTVMGDGSPSFSEDDLAAPEEAYAPLDGLGRCGVAMAVVSRDTMPTGERGSIGMVKPSGWHTVRYDDLIADRYLYNRCHLIGFQLTGENANERNLITGTRHMNVEGMLPFESLVADYVEETGNRVLYRVTPVFIGDELVARGVQMEAMSVEDGGAGVSFNVFCHNVQPGIEIDYATGGSRRAAMAEGHAHGGADGDDGAVAYVLNTGSGKFHLPDCPSVSKMSDRNRRDVTSAYDEMTAEGFSPCANCLSESGDDR